MFGGKKMIQEVASVETIIGKNTEFKGTITSQGTVRVDGKLEGELISSGDVVVGETGVIQAQIKAKNLTVAGEVRGNVDIADRLDLLATAKLFGDIKIKILTIEEGAVFKGASEMKHPEAGLQVSQVAATKKD